MGSPLGATRFPWGDSALPGKAFAAAVLLWAPLVLTAALLIAGPGGAAPEGGASASDLRGVALVCIGWVLVYHSFIGHQLIMKV